MKDKLERMFDYRHEITSKDSLEADTEKESRSLKILITGSSGLIGSALVPYLSTQGHQVKRLIRHSSANENPSWNPSKNLLDAEDLEGYDAIVHLAGENIASGRWTDERKAQLIDSRILSTRLLVDRLSRLKKPPATLISASAIGFYGDREAQTLSEASAPGTGFLAELCQSWEAEANKAKELGIRVVNLRIGVVLTPRGGMMQKLLPPFEMGAGGPIGSGKQFMSWVSIDDLISIIKFAITTESLSGPLNAVAPNPVSNAQFTKILGKVLSRPTMFAVPAFGAKLVFGEMAEQTMLSSCRAMPDKLLEAGYEFRQPDIETALRHILGRHQKIGTTNE